jgi:hypothetical protein
MVTRQLDLDFNLVGNVIGKPVAWLHNLLIDITGH